MSLYKFFVDAHLEGPHQIEVDWQYGPDCYYLGDNVDIKWGTGRYWVKVSLLKWFQLMFKDRFVRGNHELNVIDAPDYIVVNGFTSNGILMTHGDHLFWGEKIADTYRGRKPVKNWFRRFLIGFFTGFMAQFLTVPISQGFKERAFEKAKKLGCRTVVCGHWHPHKMVDFSYRGIRIIVLPRGRTDLEL
jgi:hypothetical protein